VRQKIDRVQKPLLDYTTRCQELEGYLKKNWDVDGFLKLFVEHIGTPVPTVQDNRRREQRKRKIDPTERKTSKKAKTSGDSDHDSSTETPLVEVTTEEEAIVAFGKWREPLKATTTAIISKKLEREHGGFAPDHKTVIAIRKYCKGVGGSIGDVLTSPQYRQWEHRTLSKANNVEEKKDESVEDIVNTTKQMMADILRDDDSTTQRVDQDGSRTEEKEESVQGIINSVKKMVAEMLAE
jgi:hypothetical protein